MCKDDHILVGFCTDKSDWISTVIRWLTWWKHSHVVLVSPDARQFIEATHGKGVVLGNLCEFLDRDGAELRIIRDHDPDEVWSLALSQVGKPYDWRYTFGWLFHRDWQDPKSWSCSELISWATELFPAEFNGRISPRDIYLMSVPFTE